MKQVTTGQHPKAPSVGTGKMQVSKPVPAMISSSVKGAKMGSAYQMTAAGSSSRPETKSKYAIASSDTSGDSPYIRGHVAGALKVDKAKKGGMS